MKTTQEIKTDIDTLVRKQGNQGALKLGEVLDDIVDNLSVVNKVMANIPDVATFQTAVPNTATEIVFAYYGGVDLTGYTKSGNIGKDIDVYADDTKYAVVSGKTIFAPENSVEFFRSYTALTSLVLDNFDTSKVTTFASMFRNCSGLTSLDLSNFNTANVTDFSQMFRNCSGLTSLDVSNFNTANVTDFSQMFNGCSGLTSLDVSNFNTANVTDFSQMFNGCSGLTSLDLSNFDTSKATTFLQMFRGCSGLTTITANDWSATVTSTDMFTGCTSLVGGNGTTYDASHVDASYAHIDVADNPGYFTAPA